MDALKILKKKVDETSIGKVAKELGISKASVSLLSRKRYPNPQKMYGKIIDRYGSKQEIIGVETKIKDLKELAKELECI